MPHKLREEVIIPENLAGKRLDIALFALLSGENPLIISRSQINGFIVEGKCKNISNNTINKPSYKVKTGEKYLLDIPEPIADTPKAQAIEIDIIYEDKDIIVINKAAGMVVHPAAGHADGTLVNALLAHCGNELSGIGGVKRPGIVHRIDKDTSGLMVVAKNDIAHQKLTTQLANRTLSRIYLALVWGLPSPPCAVIDKNIARSSSNRKKMAIVENGGKTAITEYEILKIINNGVASLIECRLKTGRTHQIRVHMASEKHWLVGDKIYRPNSFKTLKKGSKGLFELLYKFPRQALHAYKLKFIHPKTNQEMSFKAKIPDDFKNILLACDINIS